MVAVAPLTVVKPLAEMEEAAVEPLVKMKSDRVRASGRGEGGWPRRRRRRLSRW